MKAMSGKKKIAIIAAAVVIAAAVALILILTLPKQAEPKDYYLYEDAIYKPEAPLNEDQIAIAAEKINAVISAHGEANSFTLAIVPDKNYYLPAESGVPKMDYAALQSQLLEQVSGCNYVNLFEVLSLEDYYRTDPHWRQERLGAVADKLLAELAVPTGAESYREVTLAPYSGIYLKQSGLSASTEELKYLTDDVLENAVVTSVEANGTMKVYDEADFENKDSYDVFLGGAAAVLYIENPSAVTEKELVLFRDSFGSSLAPLLVSGYKKITLVDPRYIFSTLVDDYVNYTDADVLFLYSTLLLNKAAIMK